MNYYKTDESGMQIIFILIVSCLIFVMLYIFSILNKISAKKISQTDEMDIKKMKLKKRVDIKSK